VPDKYHAPQGADPEFSRRCAEALASPYFRGSGTTLERLQALDQERSDLRDALMRAASADQLPPAAAESLRRAEAAIKRA
jgi:hypothetical protein